MREPRWIGSQLCCRHAARLSRQQLLQQKRRYRWLRHDRVHCCFLLLLWQQKYQTNPTRWDRVSHRHRRHVRQSGCWSGCPRLRAPVPYRRGNLRETRHPSHHQCQCPQHYHHHGLQLLQLYLHCRLDSEVAAPPNHR